MADNDSTLTRCPHCQTRFRVTPGQLAAASGKVRCGHCMKVFNAREHAEEGPEQEQPSAEHKPEPSQQPPSEEPSPAAEPSPETTQPSDKEEASEDELIFADDPEEDATDKRYAGAKAEPDYEFDESFLALEKGEVPTFYDTFDEDTDEQPLDDDESWAESLLEEEGLAEDNSTDTTASRNDDWDLPDPDPLEHELNKAAEPTRSAPQSAPKPPRTDQDHAATAQAETSGRKGGSSDIWEGLRSRPISAPATGDRRFSGLLWPALAVALLSLLVYQVGWVHQDRLAQIPELRPWYERWCDLTGCQLRALQDIDRIESRQLVVRSHPEQQNALLVEATLVNRADFSQPFPAIALSFSNLNNDIVAQRVFQPREYLGGDARELNQMPSATPFRISLSLHDPGRDAISYRIDFLPSS